jgi:hypothetical protein
VCPCALRRLILRGKKHVYTHFIEPVTAARPVISVLLKSHTGNLFVPG